MKIVTLIGILVFFQPAAWGATRANDGKLSSRNDALIEPFLGDFLGSLNTAETPSPYDDLNHNLCGGPDDPPCRDEYNNPTPHLSPLANVIFRVSRNSDGKIQASIFQTTEQYRSNTPIDLTGSTVTAASETLLNMTSRAKTAESPSLISVFRFTRESAATD